MGVHQTGFDGIIAECDDKDLYFVLNVREALQKLAEKPKGKLLIAKIVASDPAHKGTYKLRIYAPTKRELTQNGYALCFGNMFAVPPCGTRDGKVGGNLIPGAKEDNITHSNSIPDSETPGRGSATNIRWNSSQILIPLTGKHVPPFIGLAHELIHAYHHLYGLKKTTEKKWMHEAGIEMTTQEEEWYTTGIKGYEEEEITENKIRDEWKIELRTDYP
jgi:hypothetical protein